MNEENLEITKELENLEEIENNPHSPAIDIENEIIDINEKMNSIEETIESIDKLSEEVKDIKPKKKIKKKLKDKWNSLSKNKKIAIIIIIVLFLLLILSVLGIIFLNKEEKENKNKKENIIFESDNYRYENGYLIFLDKNDKELGKYECKTKDEETCYVAYYEIDENSDTSKKIDEKGNVLQIRTEIINNNYVFINDKKDEEDKKIILYDIKNSETLEEYNAVKSIKDKYAVVKDYSDSYGIIELNEELSTIIDFNYDNISIMPDEDKNYIIVNESGRNYLIDINEKAISKAITMNIVNYNEEYIVGIDDNKKYYIYDYKNKLIFDDSFDYVKLYNEYILVIKDDQIHLSYYNGKKITENIYDIKTEYPYYQKVYVFDEDNNLVKEYEPFVLTEENNTITLTIGEKDYIINKIESKLSANTDYINYFDGILYFYDNIDKTNLIGTYKCSNKNLVSEDTTTFANCFIANDTSKQDNDMTIATSSGMIPILNHRYVFIKDNPNAVSEENTNIVLYDLVNKKSISKYTSVNTNLNTKLFSPSFLTESNINIIAKNKSGNYGVITLNADSELSSLISFNYKSIENIGENYLASDNSGYSLFDKTGKELTKKVTNKIRGYNSNYMKVYENNSYYIYDYEGKKITTTSYKYIELYDNYFAAVDSLNKLNIYSYNDASNSLINDSIQLFSNKYYGEGQVAFKITFIGNTANVEVLNNQNYTKSVYSLSKENQDANTATSTTNSENVQSEVNNE